jgi:hypothetical protein
MVVTCYFHPSGAVPKGIFSSNVKKLCEVISPARIARTTNEKGIGIGIGVRS